jgi:hypothetical protein
MLKTNIDRLDNIIEKNGKEIEIWPKIQYVEWMLTKKLPNTKQSTRARLTISATKCARQRSIGIHHNMQRSKLDHR